MGTEIVGDGQLSGTALVFSRFLGSLFVVSLGDWPGLGKESCFLCLKVGSRGSGACGLTESAQVSADGEP